VDISPILGGAVTNYTYFWVIPGAATVTGQNTATLNTNAVGAYTILVTNTVSGCTTSGQVLVTVCTGIKNLMNSESSYLLFPNPGSGVFYLETTQIVDAITLFNAEGKRLKDYINVSLKTELNMENEPAGLYFLYIRSQDGSSNTVKLIKE
jgi:hypothetical protein